jgi:periplasmic copper chaperone A
MTLFTRLPRLAEAFAAAIVAAALLLAAPAALVAHEYEVGELRIDHPWTRASPGLAKIAGGYLTIANRGAADRLVSVSADIAGRTEIHEMAMDGGVMTMRQITGGLAVPAGGEVALQPGGLHLMFMDLRQPLKEGERFDATLTFEGAGSVVVTFMVEAVAAGGKGHH